MRRATCSSCERCCTTACRCRWGWTVNLLRADWLPAGVAVEEGGPQLHGVGRAQARGVVRVAVTIGGGLKWENIPFIVVDSLPVSA